MAAHVPQIASVFAYFTRHKTAANLLFVLMLVLGIAAFPNMRAQFFPDVVSDDISVRVVWDGAGAEDVDAGIIQLLEPALIAVEGVESTSSQATEGRAYIAMEFEPGWDMFRAQDDVEGALDLVSNLPDDAEDPQVRRDAWRDRVTDVIITGPVDIAQLGRFTDEFVTRLFAAGVTRTTIRGIAAPETVVEVTSLSLIENNVTMAEIASAIAAEAEADPAGDVAGAARVRTGVAKRSADEIEAIVLRPDPGGASLTIGDVARIFVNGPDRERTYFVGENPAVSIRVDRSPQGDAIEIQRQVETVASDMELSLPEGTRIDLIRTRAEAISARLSILYENGLMGLALVVLLLFLFLNARTAFWVAAGIPVAMTAAIALMYAAGLTLNMVSLFALIITLGIVVDDAIVVGEHADFRARRLGEDPKTAASRAASRMFLPVFSATITTVIAFFGLVAIGGRFGELILDIPFTVIVVLIASLVECFLILPNHMAHALAHTAKEHWYDWPSRQVNKGFRWVRETLFRPFIAGVIHARYLVLAGATAILASQAVLVISGDVQWRFFNAPERGSISANFAMAPGATRDDTIAQMQSLQATVAEVGAHFAEENDGVNPISYVVAEVGGNTGRGLSGSDLKEPEQLGSVAIELIDADLRAYSSFVVLGELQDRLVRHPMVETISFRSWRSGPGGDALSVEIFGAETDTLKAAAEALKDRVSAFPEVSAVEDNMAYDKEELVLDLTPQGQALGLTIDDLGRTLRNRLNGIEAATYPDGPRSASIRVELPPGELTADFIDRTQVRTASGAYVPLADVVTVDSRTGFSSVRRENGIRLISVTGDISEDDPARAQSITETLRDTILPELETEFGVATEMAGLAEDEDRFLTEAMTGLILSLTGIFLTLAWVFSSWTRPIVVMSVIPFGLVGMIYGHAAWDVPLSMFSIVGLIGMSGIIINDSIVLVTTVDDYAKDRGLIPAIIDGAADRLRPVFLTTATTVLGLTPLLYEGSQQAEFLKPTVITLTYGLGFGMVLVLLLVPSLLAMQHDVAKFRAAFRRGFSTRATGLQTANIIATLGVMVWFAATLGATILNGAPLVMVETMQDAGLGAAFGLFLIGAAAIALLVWAVTALRIKSASSP
ncbi:MAG: efflux RND transporter permease subunit [Pseudomonadota bacterium]